MIDNILHFADEAAAQAALPSYCVTDADGIKHWDQSRVIPGLSIITAEAVWDNSGERPVLVSPEVTLPGFWLAIGLSSSSSLRADLAAMDECVLIADRAAANRGEQFIVYMGSSVDPQVVASARVAPVFAGSRYPFGAG